MPDRVDKSRRSFLQYSAMLAATGQALLATGDVRAAIAEGRETAGLADPWPEMTCRTLGRTGFDASRLVFGCGAALYSGRRDELLDRAFEAGVNVFDVGFSGYYNDAEKNLAPFLEKRRDDIYLISKAYVPTEADWNETVSVAEAKRAAAGWLEYMDGSLKELQVDHVDAYYLMASNNVSIVGSDEIRMAFERARDAGKVSHLGLSTHQNAENVLKTAIETGWYDLAMIAITPGGWYDWESKEVLEGSPPMKTLRPLLDEARAAGIGLVGMKAGRFLAGRRWLSWGNPDAFDEHYDERLLAARLSSFQKSYAFVLENGLDVVNADMQNMAHLKENFIAAAESTRFAGSVA